MGFRLAIAILLIASSCFALEKIPEQTGFGTESRFEYGNSQNPTIIIVNTLTYNTALTDSTRNGVSVKQGGLYSALNWDTPNKIILFEKGGVINPGSITDFNFRGQYVALRGETAPGTGIFVQDAAPRIRDGDLLMTHMTWAAGDEGTCPSCDRDSMQVYPNNNEPMSNVYIDHCSFLWGIDETLSVYSDYYTDVQNVTISNSIIGEALKDSIHSDGTSHSKGLFVSGRLAATATRNVAILRNLITHCDERTPYLQGVTDVYYANNYIHNAGSFHVFLVNAYKTFDINMTNNIALGGNNSATAVKNDWLTLWTALYNDGEGSTFYAVGNWAGEYTAVAGTPQWNEQQANSSDWDGIDDRFDLWDESVFMVTSENITLTDYTPWDTADVQANIIANVGPFPNNRNDTNDRLVGYLSLALANTGSIIDTVTRTNADCTGWQEPMYCCTGSGEGSCDQNYEAGWPTISETTRSLDSIFPLDPHSDDDSDGYTNLEEFVQGFKDYVEGSLDYAEDVSPADGDTDTGITADATWDYNDQFVNSVDVYLDKAACSTVNCDTTIDSDDDTDKTYDMGTLDVSSTYCLSIKANLIISEQGECQEFEFTTADGPPPDPATLGDAKYSANAGDRKYSANAGDALTE